MPKWNALIAPSDMNGYLNIIGKVLTKFRSSQPNGFMNGISSSTSKDGIERYYPETATGPVCLTNSSYELG
jgi:hypothetical protein